MDHNKVTTALNALTAALNASDEGYFAPVTADWAYRHGLFLEDAASGYAAPDGSWVAVMADDGNEVLEVYASDEAHESFTIMVQYDTLRDRVDLQEM